MSTAPPPLASSLPDLRHLFPGTLEQIYLDVSLNGLVPITAREAALRHLDRRVMGRADKADLHAQAERVRNQVARLLGAHSDEIAITKNVSEGLNLFAASLTWKAGDNVVLCPELEHPNNVFLWYNLRDGKGVELREIPPEGGHIPVDRMVEAMDERTRVVTASHVTFSPGFVTDVQTLSRAAHSRGALLLVDAAQSAGAVEIDVKDLDVDAMALGTQKSLLGLYGLGFLFVKRELADSVRPAFAARYGVDLGPGANETAIGDGEIRFKVGARRFDLSNYSYVALAAVEPSLDLILSVGMDHVEAHVRGLAARLAAGLLETGLPVAGGVPGPHLAHIVAVGEGAGGRRDRADDPPMDELHRHLGRNGVRLSIRRGVLRMSLGIYNDRADVDRVVDLCRSWKARR
jgi:cysteine desulfurase / selenocysteine lyase